MALNRPRRARTEQGVGRSAVVMVVVNRTPVLIEGQQVGQLPVRARPAGGDGLHVVELPGGAGNRRKGRLSALRAHTKAPYKMDFRRKTPRSAKTASPPRAAADRDEVRGVPQLAGPFAAFVRGRRGVAPPVGAAAAQHVPRAAGAVAEYRGVVVGLRARAGRLGHARGLVPVHPVLGVRAHADRAVAWPWGREVSI